MRKKDPEIHELRRKRFNRDLRKRFVLEALECMPGATMCAIARHMNIAPSTYLLNLLHEMVSESKLLRFCDVHVNRKAKYRFCLPKHQPSLF